MRQSAREPDQQAFAAAILFLVFSAVASAVNAAQAAELLAMLAYLSLLLGIAFAVVRHRLTRRENAKSDPNEFRP